MRKLLKILDILSDFIIYYFLVLFHSVDSQIKEQCVDFFFLINMIFKISINIIIKLFIKVSYTSVYL